MKGFININKPVGYSSAKIVTIVKNALKLTKKDKIGDMGTLDPQASGVLPIAVGRATRLFDYLLSKEKTYVAEFRFGYQTDTLDSAGEIVLKVNKIPTKDEINNILPQFLGEIIQLPPQYSAKSINGIRAYDLARKGKEVELKPCKVFVRRFDLLHQKDENTFVFEIECGSGTYIRSLCRDLAQSLGSCATMVALTRTKCDVFKLENAVSIQDLSEKNILPIDIVLQKLTRLDICEDTYKDLLNGKKVYLDKAMGLYRLYLDKELVGICNIDNQGIAKMKIWL